MEIKELLKGGAAAHGRLVELFGSVYVVEIGLPDNAGAGAAWLVPLHGYLRGDHDDRHTPDVMPLERGIVLPWRLEYLPDG
jgi:hypothetical protein